MTRYRGQGAEGLRPASPAAPPRRAGRPRTPHGRPLHGRPVPPEPIVGRVESPPGQAVRRCPGRLQVLEFARGERPSRAPARTPSTTDIHSARRTDARTAASRDAHTSLALSLTQAIRRKPAAPLAGLLAFEAARPRSRRTAGEGEGRSPAAAGVSSSRLTMEATVATRPSSQVRMRTGFHCPSRRTEGQRLLTVLDQVRLRSLRTSATPHAAPARTCFASPRHQRGRDERRRRYPDHCHQPQA